MREFEGKTAVVTGAASDTGRALAERFVADGMNVVLADSEEDALDRAGSELQNRRSRVIGVPVNTALRASVQALATRAVGEFGKVHLLCNNAGVASRNDASRAAWELPAADWHWLMGVNFWGVLYGLQAFLPAMLAHGGGGPSSTRRPSEAGCRAAATPDATGLPTPRMRWRGAIQE